MGLDWLAEGILLEMLKKRNTFLLFAAAEASQTAASETSVSDPPEEDVKNADCHHHQQYRQRSSCPVTHDSKQQQQQRQALPGQLLGYLVMQVNSITAHINKLAVDPAVRRQGVATALLQVRHPPQPHPVSQTTHACMRLGAGEHTATAQTYLHTQLPAAVLELHGGVPVAAVPCLLQPQVMTVWLLCLWLCGAQSASSLPSYITISIQHHYLIITITALH